jgi:hypothetical protein
MATHRSGHRPAGGLHSKQNSPQASAQGRATREGHQSRGRRANWHLVISREGADLRGAGI